jgi:hypothetical protein
VPEPHVSTLTGTMQTLITRWPQFGFNSSDTTSGVALTLVFEPDYVGVTLTGGWPAVTFNNSAPPAPATESLTVSLANTPYGQFEPETGHLRLHALLGLDFTPDPWFARRDQQVEMTVSTHSEDLRPTGHQMLVSPGACERFWANEAFPTLGMAGESSFYTTDFIFSNRRGWDVGVAIFGRLVPPPPRHPTPAPRTVVPNVRELDRDTADEQVRDAGLVPAHIPSNAAADSWVSHQIPAAGQNVDVGSVVTLQLQAGAPL